MDAAKVSSERVLVTPHLAKQFLEMNHPLNRNRRATHIQFLANEIMDGRFVETGSPVVFDSEGFLVDGQHRLEAIVLAGVPVILWIVNGVDPGSIHKIDIGLSRSHADISKIIGRKDGTHRLAFASAVFLYLLGRKRVPIEEKWAFLDSYDGEIEYIMSLTTSDPHKKKVQTGGFRTCALLVSLRSNDSTTEDFVNAARFGENIKRDHPCMAYRTALDNAMHRGRLADRMPFEFGIIAAHKVVTGSPCTVMKPDAQIDPAIAFFKPTYDALFASIKENNQNGRR